MSNAISTSTWFVTGIGRGLGRSIAEEILGRGGKLAGTVRKRSQVDALAKQFPDQLWVAELDLSDTTSISKVFAAACAHFGRIDAVVNNAAYSLLGAAEEVSISEIRHILDTNLIGSIEVARAAVAHMRQQGNGGRLIQVSSSAGQAAFPGVSLYCASKWGVEGFFESLGIEVAPFGIQTTLVQPGTIRTEFGASGAISAELDAYRDNPAGLMRRMAKEGYPAPGDPAKMAKAIVDTFEMEAAPPRLALGPDAYNYIRAALTARLQQLEAVREITHSTDCDDVAAAQPLA